MSNMEVITNAKTSDEQKKPIRPNDPELDEAVDRVYRKYGSDLEAFVRDVQKELQKKSEGSNKQAASASRSGAAFL